MGKVRQGPTIGARSKRVIYLLLFIYIITYFYYYLWSFIYYLFIIIYCENFPRTSIGRLQKTNRDLYYTVAVNFTTHDQRDFTLSCNVLYE